MSTTADDARTGTPPGRIAGLIAGLIVFALPLAVLPGAFAPFHAGKWFLGVVLVPVGLALCAAAGRLRWPRRNWFLAWLAVVALATAAGVAPWMSLAGAPQRNAGLLAALLGVGAFVLGASVGDDPGAQRTVLRAAFLSGALVGLFAVAEWAGVDLFGFGDLDEADRARSSWGSATFAGSHLVLVLPLAVVHVRSRDPRWRTLAIASTVAIVAGVLATGTRGAWVAAAVGAAVLAPTWLRTASPHADGRAPGRHPRGTTVGVALGVVAAVVIAVAVMAPALQRSSASGRLDLWRTSLPAVAERPLLGGGPDSQRITLPAAIDESFEQEHGSDELHDRAHNVVLDTLLTTGVLGLLAGGALVFVLGRDVAAHARGRLVPAAIAAGLASYAVTLLFAFGDPAIDPVAWVLAGVLLSQTGADRSTRQVTTAARVAVVAFGVVAVAGAAWAGGEVLAERRLADAFDAHAAGDLPRALDTLESAAGVAPARFDLDQIAARLVTQSLDGRDVVEVQRDARATEAAADALTRLDRAARVAGADPDLLMDRAELLSASGRPDDALALYDQILVAYPNSFRAHLGLGLAAARADRLDTAESAWRTAARLGPEDARAATNLGVLSEGRGDAASAREWFDRALEIDPDDPVARAGAARVSDVPAS